MDFKIPNQQNKIENSQSTTGNIESVNQDIEKTIEDYKVKIENGKSVIENHETIPENGQSVIDNVKSMLENIKIKLENAKNIIEPIDFTNSSSNTNQILKNSKNKIYMKIKTVNTENQAFEAIHLALTNAEAQPEIASTIATYGYTTEVIAEGKSLLEETLTAYNFNKKENNETREARADFDEKCLQMNNTYSKHRKLARVVFRNDILNWQKLELKGRVPKSYVNWLASLKIFYSEIVADENIQTKLSRLKFTKEEAENCLVAITDIENTRTTYLREIGESQEATQSKDAAFANLDSWMQDFYAVAKIAMEDKPQLLEAIGILVRS